MTRLNLNTKAAQDQIIAFQAGILARDPVAPTAYADWLEENGHPEKARQVRYRARYFSAYKREDGTKETRLEWNERINLTGKIHGLVPKCTAFEGWYASSGHRRATTPNGLRSAYDRGYVPTLSRSNSQQEKLGRMLEALGKEVFWIG